MGFDLYGRNPENVNNVKPPTIDWSKDPSEEERDKYFEAQDEFRKAVPGDYFRANVWWWRPIWNFVTEFCDDFLTEKDLAAGNYNDAHFISKSKAKRIATRIKQLDKDGTIDGIQKQYNVVAEEAKKHNSKIEKKLNNLRKRVVEATGKKNIIPADYPSEYRAEWDILTKSKNWSDSYPFDKEFLLEFAEFCKYSGGFEIC